MRRRAVIAAGAAGLVITGVFTAGSTDSPAAQLTLTRQAANQTRMGRVTKLARSGAATAGARLLGEAAAAARSVPYRGVQIISWLAPGSSAAWLGSSPGRVSMVVSHRSGQPPDVGLGLSPTLVGLLDAHYVVVYTGQGAAAGRAASVVEVCHRDGSVAARFWLDDTTKLPLRREIFGNHARLISMDGLARLKLTARAAPGSASARPAAGYATSGVNAASALSPATVSHQRASSHVAGNSISAEISMAGFAGLPPAASRNARVPLTRPSANHLGYAQLAALRTGGWPVPATMPGGLTLYGASESGPSTGRVLDLAYSDGLSVISLFLQRGQLPAALPGWRQTQLGGHPVYLRNPAEPDLAWSSGGYVYTVVAGAPAPVIASVVDSLPYQGRPGFWSRMDRGMRRMFSWINPFR